MAAPEGSCARAPRVTSLLVFIILSFTTVIPIYAQPEFRHRLETLRTHLLSNYTGHYAPFEKADHYFTIYVSFTLFTILDLDAANQILSTLSYVVVQWIDPELSWNYTSVDSPGKDIEFIQLDQDSIWTPKLLLINRAEDEQRSVIDHYDMITVHYRGVCIAHLPMKLATTCQVDVTKYPFDTQVCKVSFAPLYGDNIQIVGEVLRLPLLQFFDVSGEWELLYIDVYSHNVSVNSSYFQYPFAQFSITLRRRYIFYLLTIVFPLMLLSFTGACGFLLPLECGEKVSFQVAILVTLAVFLGFINDAMPKTLTIPVLAIYVDLLLFQSCMAFLATLTVLRGHHHMERLQQKDKERKYNVSKEPTDQSMRRGDDSHLKSASDVQADQPRRKRLAAWLRRVVRRWYCCCCCIHPQFLDTFFFIVFMSLAVASPIILFIFMIIKN